MVKKIFCGVWACLVLCSGQISAQELSWDDIGRENMDCATLVAGGGDEKVIFAGCGSLLKSTDAGKSWRRVLCVKGNPAQIFALEYIQSTVYAASGNGLYRSLDKGKNWERVFRGKSSLEKQCTAILVNPQAIFLGTHAGMFISPDNGRTWIKQKTGLDATVILNIAQSAGGKPVIYLATPKAAFRSLDSGKSWEKIFDTFFSKEEIRSTDEDVPEEGPVNQVNFVKPDAMDMNLVYLSTAKGVYLSRDQGRNWEKLPDYGLLSRNVKRLAVSRRLGLLALSANGIFLYSGARWTEISSGMPAVQLNDLSLDDSDRIYVASKKGIFRSSVGQRAAPKPCSFFEEYLKAEPGIKAVQEAAIRYAEVDPEKINRWRKAASKKALLPQVSIGLDRNSTDLWHWEGGSTTKNEDDCLRRGKETVDWDVSLSWDLSDLFWNDAQTGIDVRSKLMVELRNDILDQVNKLYFERLRLKSELDSLAIEDGKRRLEKQLKLAEVTASLDALTGGYYSEQLRLFASG